MNPTRCFELMTEAEKEGDAKAAALHAANLIYWITTGGFPPDGMTDEEVLRIAEKLARP